MKILYRCETDIVIVPCQYFARKGEKIFYYKNSFMHIDRDGTTLYKDSYFDTVCKNDNSWKVSDNFSKGFQLFSKKYKSLYNPSELQELKSITHGPPIIIGGCGRSGTTLMLSILGAHSKIFAISEETHAFYPRPYKLRRIVSYLKNNDKKLRWCEKTPKNILCYNEIIDLFDGNVKVINMIRDGRDVITSMHPNGKGRYWVSKERWIEDNKKCFKDHRVLDVKFENLIQNPKKTLKNICNHIGEDFESHLLNYYEETNIKNNIAWLAEAKPIGMHNSTRWQNKDHKKVIDDFMKDQEAIKLMCQFGYMCKNV